MFNAWQKNASRRICDVIHYLLTFHDNLDVWGMPPLTLILYQSRDIWHTVRWARISIRDAKFDGTIVNIVEDLISLKNRQDLRATQLPWSANTPSSCEDRRRETVEEKTPRKGKRPNLYFRSLAEAGLEVLNRHDKDLISAPMLEWMMSRNTK